MFLVNLGLALLIGFIMGCIRFNNFYPFVSSFIYYFFAVIVISIFCQFAPEKGLNAWLWGTLSILILPTISLLVTVGVFFFRENITKRYT